MRPNAGRALTALLLTAALMTGCSGDDPAVVETLPEVTLDRLGGDGSVDLATLTGPLVVNLWGSWCLPCREEMPVLEDFSQEYEGRVEVIGIDFQDEPAAGLDFARATGVTYDLLQDPDGVLSAAPPFPALRGLPFFAFVDKEGTVVHMEFSIVEDVEALEALVQQHLGVTG